MNLQGRKRSGIDKDCIKCGKKFYVPTFRAATALYCGRECMSGRNGSKVEFTCQCCKKIFYRSPSYLKRYPKILFCSLECKGSLIETVKEKRAKSLAYSKLKKGNNASRNLRRYVFQIKNKICEICDYKEYDYCLEVHHIDNNPNNNDIENLAVLCVLCHRKGHKKDLGNNLLEKYFKSK